MKGDVLVKTLLCSYRCLAKIANSIDKYVRMRAYNCMLSSYQNFYANSTMTVSLDILELINKKINLINLKLCIEEMLKTCDKNLARILIMRFIENIPASIIAKRFGICERTVFRKQNKALSVCIAILHKIEDSKITIKKVLNKEKWVIRIYNQILDAELRKKNLENYEDFTKSLNSYNLFKEIKNSLH